MKKLTILLVLLCLVGCSGGSDSGGGIVYPKKVSGYGYDLQVSENPIRLKLYKTKEGKLELDYPIVIGTNASDTRIYLENSVDWFIVPQNLYTYRSGPYTVNFKINLSEHSAGVYETTIKIECGNFDRLETVKIEVPVIIEIRDSLLQSTPQFQFGADNSQAVLPASQLLTIDLFGLLRTSFKVLSTNTVQKDWYKIDKTSTGLKVSMIKNLPAGTYSSDIQLRYDYQGFTALEPVNIVYKVDAVIPKLFYVSPATMAVGEKFPLIIRGVGFAGLNPADIQIEGIQNPVVSIESDTLIRVSHDGFLSNGDKAITFASGSDSAISLKIDPYMDIKTYEHLDFTGMFTEGDITILKVIVDEVHNAIFFEYEKAISYNYTFGFFKYHRVDDNWVFDQQKTIGNLFTITPDMKYLIVSSDNKTIEFLDSQTLDIVNEIDMTPIMPVYDLPDYVAPLFYLPSKNKGIFNNGKMLMERSLPPSLSTNVHEYSLSVFDFNNLTVMHSDILAGSTNIMDKTSSRMTITRTNTFDSEYFGYYDSTIDDFVMSIVTDDLDGIYANWFAFCGEGEIFVSHRSVFDVTDFSVVGLLNTSDQLNQVDMWTTIFNDDCSKAYSWPSRGYLENGKYNELLVYTDPITQFTNNYPVRRYLDFSSIPNAASQTYQYGGLKYVSPDDSYVVGVSWNGVSFFSLNFLP